MDRRLHWMFVYAEECRNNIMNKNNCNYPLLFYSLYDLLYVKWKNQYYVYLIPL